MCRFAPDAEPLSLLAQNTDNVDNLDMKVKMELHRALLRGNGFYQFMAANPAVTGADEVTTTMESRRLDDKDPTKLRQLPIFDLLGSGKYADAVVQEALPADRQRFRAYLSKRLLGVAIITAVSYSPSQLIHFDSA